ncbi:hypothetical protein NECAME_16807 [Necator americanus]|uniref:Aldehyde dehydrogenase domain-containing protein n=1 Tax=Necator americanus TaxID=51031 RepID=W2TUM2_NECAM|nr:hypothetical protein NECAME_16807 [Necator americanus]ETN85334.1 hypothetical protein NECAME_16807 [Necator americanus]
MKDEIFGPFLPILTVKSFDESLDYVNDHEKPLGAYLFTKDLEKVTKRFLRETSSGGVTVNDVMMHSWVNSVPFGGVGNSGMGQIGGKFGFDSFVHHKPILIRNGIGKDVVCKL